jgi:hypothetical protein
MLSYKGEESDKWHISGKRVEKPQKIEVLHPFERLRHRHHSRWRTKTVSQNVEYGGGSSLYQPCLPESKWKTPLLSFAIETLSRMRSHNPVLFL